MASNEEVEEGSRARMDGAGGAQCTEHGELVDTGHSPLVVHVVAVGSVGVAHCCHRCCDYSSLHTAAAGALEEGEMEIEEGGMLWLVMRKTMRTMMVLLMEHSPSSL